MKHFLLFICIAVAVLSGCHKAEEEELSTLRTVIVYMSAENNLSSDSDTNLKELKAGSNVLNKRQRLIVFKDDAKLSSNPVIIELKGGESDTLFTYESDFYASDPAAFREVIEKIEHMCPAESYGLVLWGHAKGWLIEKDSIASAQSRLRKAYGVDNGYNQSIEHAFGRRWLNISQMARALDGLPRFRFIFADCCCMMCVETAYELRHTADYLIGSPAEIPARGAPYEQLVPFFFSENDQLYVSIIDAYYISSGNRLPLSVVDLTQIQQLAEATRLVLMAPENYDTENIAYYYCDKNDYPVMFDMGSIMERNLDKTDYAEWLKALNTVVPYKKFSKKWTTDTYSFDVWKGFDTSIFSEDNYGGLSMFVSRPEYNFSKNYDFNHDIRLTSWYWAVGWDRFE